jgi:spermidine synthase
MAATSRTPGGRAARALPLLVFASGAAALVYESLWMRSFGLVFGNTTDAVAMVLAVFMGGLALGSLIAARRPSADPLRAYALVELGIGAAALLTLPALKGLPGVYGALTSRLGLEGMGELLGRAALAAIVLLPATILLGARVPLAVEFLARSGREPHAGFGRLYLVNTLGGAAGVVLAPFVLVPALGTSGALVAAAGLSLLVAAGGWRLRRESGPAPSGPPRAPTAVRTAPALGLSLAAASGAATFGAEVLWTRSLVLVIGSSVYAFNLMLLAVLLGIAGGALVYARVRDRIRRPAHVLGLLFAAAGIAVLAGQHAIGWLPVVYLGALRWLPVSFAAHQLAGFSLCLLAMLPVTLLLGLTFPLLLHLLDVSARPAQTAAGRLYAWNTGGAIAGALAADLLLVPRLGLQPSYLMLAAPLLVGGAWALAAAVRARPLIRLVPAAGAAALLLIAAPHWRPWDPVLMSAGVYRYGLEWRDRLDSASDLGRFLREERRLLFYREGREAVVAVSEPAGGGRRVLSINGKTDAGSGAEDVVTQKLIAHVPLVLHPGPRSALVIGWGAGATAAAASLHPIETLECVEIEPATFEAAPFFEALSGRLVRDPRFQIVFRDGRNQLLRSTRQWDVIVSEASNPWITGVANLFTREFYAIVRARLAPGGVFGQWLHYYSLEPGDVKVEVKTFLTAFPQASLWLVPPVSRSDGTQSLGADLLLVGSQEPHRLDWGRLRRLFGGGSLAADLRSTGVISDETALAATWAMDRERLTQWVEDPGLFPGGTPLNTDERPRIELSAPRRLVTPPSEAASAAAAQYEALTVAGGEARPPLDAHPGLAAGGAAAAAFFLELADRHVAAAAPGRALIDLDAAIDADPGSVEAHARSGELLLARGRTEEGELRLRTAVRLDPSLARAWETLGALAIDRRDYAFAEEAHRGLLRREPSNVEAWLRLAAALARQRKWAEALEALEWARTIDPKAPVDPELVAFLQAQARSGAR